MARGVVRRCIHRLIRASSPVSPARPRRVGMSPSIAKPRARGATGSVRYSRDSHLTTHSPPDGAWGGQRLPAVARELHQGPEALRCASSRLRSSPKRATGNLPVSRPLGRCGRPVGALPPSLATGLTLPILPHQGKEREVV